MYVLGCSIKLIPERYKNDLINIEESIDGGKLPICSWITDPYINWLTQNGVNLGIQTAIGLGGIALAPATGGASLLATASTITSAVHQVRQQNIQPLQANGGSNQGDFNFAGTRGFNVQRRSIKEEYAKIIDDYFTRFGYKTNRLKIPNITGRTYWNYIEINSGDELGYGSVPNNFMTIINDIAHKGTTIWHNHTNIGNYNLNNTIIT